MRVHFCTLFTIHDDDDDDDDDDKSTQRAQTPPRPKSQQKVILDSNPDFRIIPDLDLDSGCLLDYSQHVVDSLTYGRQSFCQVS